MCLILSSPSSFPLVFLSLFLVGTPSSLYFYDFFSFLLPPFILCMAMTAHLELEHDHWMEGVHARSLWKCSKL